MAQKQKENSLPQGLGEPLSVAIVQMSRLDKELVNVYGTEFSKIIEEEKILMIEIIAAIEKVPDSRSQDTIALIKTLRERLWSRFSDLPKALDAADNSIWQRIEKSLRFARQRGANIIVFPELSIPFQLLTKVDALCKELSPASDSDQPLLVVAGSHYAEPSAKKIYSQLGLTAQPEEGAFAPVYSRWEPASQGEWCLIPKIKPSSIELELGKDWSLPTDPVWQTIDFGNFKIAVLICSDFINSVILGEELDGVSVILVPAYNKRHLNFEGYFRNHWSNNRKTVYANNSEPGNSKTTCTDKIFDDSNPMPFTLNTVMYTLPSLNEAVMVHSILVGNKEIRDKLVAIAPMIPSREFPQYCQFYKKYSGENKKKQVKQFKKSRGLADTISQVHEEDCYKLFSEKLSQLDDKDPSDLRDKDLDLLVDVIPLDGPGRAAARVIKLLNECKIDILVSAIVQNSETIEKMGKLAALIQKLIDAWETKMLLSTFSARQIKKPTTTILQNSLKAKIGLSTSSAEQVEKDLAGGDPNRPISNMDSEIKHEMCHENPFTFLLHLLNKQREPHKQKTHKLPKTEKEMFYTMREIDHLLLDANLFENIVEKVLQSLEEKDDNVPLIRFVNFYEKVGGVTFFLRWLIQKKVADKSSEMSIARASDKLNLSDIPPDLSTTQEKIETKDTSRRSDTGTASLKKGFEENLESLSKQIFDITFSKTGADVFEEIKIWRRNSTKMSALSDSIEIELSVLSRFLDTAGTMLIERLLSASASIETEESFQDSEMDEDLQEAGIILEMVGRIALDQACRLEPNRLDCWELAIISLDLVFHGTIVTRHLRKDLAKLLQGKTQPETRDILRWFVSLILDSVKETQKKTLVLIKEIETQSKLPVQSQNGERIQELKLELLDETVFLHHLLALVDAFLTLKYEDE